MWIRQKLAVRLALEMDRAVAFQASIQAFLVPQGFTVTMRGTIDNLPRNSNSMRSIDRARRRVNWGFDTLPRRHVPCSNIANIDRETLLTEFNGNEQRFRAMGKPGSFKIYSSIIFFHINFFKFMTWILFSRLSPLCPPSAKPCGSPAGSGGVRARLRTR